MPMDRLEMMRRVWAGIIVFSLLAAFGLRTFYRGTRGDILDSSGTPKAGRAWFIIGGFLMLLPLPAYLLFIWKQGYFHY